MSTDTTTDDDLAQLEDRIDDLEQRLNTADTPPDVTDEQGRTWTVGKLISEFGLTRREALYAIAALASGVAFREAIISSIGTAEATSPTGSIGTSNNRVDVYAESVDANSMRDIADIVVQPSDDINAVFRDDVNDGDTVYIGAGLHEQPTADPTGGGDAVFSIDNDRVEVWLHPDATVKIPDGDIPSNEFGAVCLIYNSNDPQVGRTDITIHGEGTLDANGSNNGDPAERTRGVYTGEKEVDNLAIRDINIHDCSSDFMKLGNKSGSNVTSYDWTIENVDMLKAAEGPLLLNVEDLTFQNNLIENVDTGDSLEPVRAKGFVITGNVFRDSGSGVIDIFDDCHDGVVTGNVCLETDSNKDRGGIIVDSNGAPCSRILIANNIVEPNASNTQGAIAVGHNATPNSNHSDILIANNTCWNLNDHGIKVLYGTNVHVINNTTIGYDVAPAEFDGNQATAPLRYVGSDPKTVRDSGIVNGADVTIPDVNEAFKRLDRSSDSSSTTAGTHINAYDGTAKDTGSGTANSSGQFVPDETAEYRIDAYAVLRGNTTSGNQIDWRVQNVTDGVSVGGKANESAPSNDARVGFSKTLELTAGKTYEIQVRNNDSSYVIKRFNGTQATIEQTRRG